MQQVRRRRNGHRLRELGRPGERRQLGLMDGAAARKDEAGEERRSEWIHLHGYVGSAKSPNSTAIDAVTLTTFPT